MDFFPWLGFPSDSIHAPLLLLQVLPGGDVVHSTTADLMSPIMGCVNTDVNGPYNIKQHPRGKLNIELLFFSG